MIPKKIHYCWFGNNPLDSKALKCIESWEKFFPDYEIIQWNERNFDVNQIDFMKQAYLDKKWAFVSDVARLIILNEYGGIYFDTDVEVVASYEDILENCGLGFWGIEKGNYINSGLGFGSIKNTELLSQLVDLYRHIDYTYFQDELNSIACPVVTTQLMEKKGFKRNDVLQKIDGYTIYPTVYFGAMDYHTGKVKQSKDLHSIHWYATSWYDEKKRGFHKRQQRYIRLFGMKLGASLANIDFGIREDGLVKYFFSRIHKLVS